MGLDLPASNPAFKGALDFVTALKERGCFKENGATASLEGARDQFAKGQVAMALETTGNLALFREQLGDEKVGVVAAAEARGLGRGRR